LPEGLRNAKMPSMSLPNLGRSLVRPGRAAWLVILALFLVALLLRVWGARFGLPEYVYHPDEHAIVDRAASILRTGDYSPHWFNYPSVYIYVQALSYVPYFLISAARGFGNTIPDPAPYGFYFAGRLLTALLGGLTVPLVYNLGHRLFDRRTGLIASTLLTFSLLHTVHSHYVTTDVPAAFLVTLSLLFCSLLLQKGEMRYALLAALFAGLAASTKYPAGVTLVPVLVVPWLARPERPWQVFARRTPLGLAAFVGGFLLGTPYAFLELNTFLSSLATVLGHYAASQPGFEGGGAWLWYLQQTLSSADVLAVTLGLLGVVWAVVKRRRGDLLLLSFVLPYYLLISLWRVRFERNLVLLWPPLVVLSARLLVDALSWLVARQPRVRRGEIPILACLTALTVLLPGRAILDFDRALSRTDHRTLAAEWLNANLPAGAKIVTEAFSIPLDQERFQIIQLVRIDSEGLEWYEAEGVEYVIVSDGHWRTLFEDPHRYKREIATYEQILDHSTVLMEFPGELPASLSRGYPTIPIYHFPEVVILAFESGQPRD
jgi:hypothetical protein